jgi:hypothetical protein
LGIFAYPPSNHDDKTNEMSNQPNWNQPTYSIAIPLIASTTLSYDNDWMIITYNINKNEVEK